MIKQATYTTTEFARELGVMPKVISALSKFDETFPSRTKCVGYNLKYLYNGDEVRAYIKKQQERGVI